MSHRLFFISLKTSSIVLQKEVYSQSFRQYKRIEQITSTLFLAFYQSGPEYYRQVHPSLLSGALNEDKYARVSMSELNAGTFIGLPEQLVGLSAPAYTSLASEMVSNLWYIMCLFV
ncbi:hypothetical protein CDAR_506321 [Caerostris darwini]|uniref:Uncharacterized protein n=1 Tax=Caerostris darwini TaxID=1538125 RepID=A0AAV4WR33_9ARAC|nr:hypothetical protein CDAR_506321 [Caerostris darwini]